MDQTQADWFCGGATAEGFAACLVGSRTKLNPKSQDGFLLAGVNGATGVRPKPCSSQSILACVRVLVPGTCFRIHCISVAITELAGFWVRREQGPTRQFLVASSGPQASWVARTDPFNINGHSQIHLSH